MIGPGPVFTYEWLRISRRRSMYATRSAAVAAVLVGLTYVWWSWSSFLPVLDRNMLVALGRAIASTMAHVEVTFLLLVAPAATAGGLCLDRARGTLVHVMATDLSDAEIVLGKLAASLIPVVGLVAALLPVKMLGTMLGGVDPIQPLGSSVVALAAAVLACTLAFALSARGRKAHEVLSATYLILLAWIGAPLMVELAAVGLGAGPSLGRLSWWKATTASSPYNHLVPTFNEALSDYLTRVGLFAGACLSVAALLALATTLGIRRAVLATRVRAEARPPRRAWLWVRLPSILPSPSLDANPVLWREWTRSRPSPMMRRVGRGYVVLALFLTTTSLVGLTRPGLRQGENAAISTMILVGVGLLLLSVRASATLSEERVRGSLDVLMTTPLTTWEILAGKWWGTFRLVPGLIFLPATLAYLSALTTGNWASFLLTVGYLLACGAALTSLGLAVSVWIPHQGRATAASVAAYLVMILGPTLTAIMAGPTPSGRVSGPLAAVGNPIFGATAGIIYGYRPGSTSRLFLESVPYHLATWLVCYACIALAAYLAAGLTFDRCLGRGSPPARRAAPLVSRHRFGRDGRAAAAESS